MLNEKLQLLKSKIDDHKNAIAYNDKCKAESIAGLERENDLERQRIKDLESEVALIESQQHQQQTSLIVSEAPQRKTKSVTLHFPYEIYEALINNQWIAVHDHILHTPDWKHTSDKINMSQYFWALVKNSMMSPKSVRRVSDKEFMDFLKKE